MYKLAVKKTLLNNQFGQIISWNRVSNPGRLTKRSFFTALDENHVNYADNIARFDIKNRAATIPRIGRCIELKNVERSALYALN